MKKIEIAILNQAHDKPVNMTMFLATLTQRGHQIKNAADLQARYEFCMDKEWQTSGRVLKLDHGTINRFAPVTLAIVGGSRRLLAQLRTHKIGIEWVSASLQYSDYSGEADFVVPYEITEYDTKNGGTEMRDLYLAKCHKDLEFYEEVTPKVGNDAAGYAMNQGLRNILIATASRDAWMNLIAVRSCKRNTPEAAYVASLIWEKLLTESNQGDQLYEFAGPDCLYGRCKEGFMSCAKPVKLDNLDRFDTNPARAYINHMWPALNK